MPGRLATFATWSATLSSIARTSDLSAKMMPGTRIAPRFVGSHRKSSIRFSRVRPIVPTLYRSNIDDALRDPHPAVTLLHRQFRIRRGLYLDGWLVAIRIEAFTPRMRVQSMIVQCDFETSEQHVSYRPLIDHRLQPVDDEQLVVGRQVSDAHICQLFDLWR